MSDEMTILNFKEGAKKKKPYKIGNEKDGKNGKEWPSFLIGMEMGKVRGKNSILSPIPVFIFNFYL